MRAALMLLGVATFAAPSGARAEVGQLSPAARTEVLDRLGRALNGYVDPSITARVKAMLRSRRPVHKRIVDPEELAKTLSADLIAASGDQHLKVSLATLDPAARDLTPEQEVLLEQRLAHGLIAIRRLPANIGYLKLRYFADGSEGSALVDAAMRMLKDSDALIIDLRENTGGGGAADERLIGHLSRSPLPMEAIRWRQPDGTVTIDQRRPSIAEDGPLYPDKPVFLLTARRTFSAAEAFALTLKASGRATLIGERTRGGANPGRFQPLAHGLGVFIPTGTVVHPLTGGNWNGTGVDPHVPVAADQALLEAYQRALAVAKPKVTTPKSLQEREAALADPSSALKDQ